MYYITITYYISNLTFLLHRVKNISLLLLCMQLYGYLKFATCLYYCSNPYFDTPYIMNYLDQNSRRGIIYKLEYQYITICKVATHTLKFILQLWC